MDSLRFFLLSSTLILSLLFISVSADDFSTNLDKLTDTNDVLAITMLQVTFFGLMQWNGDPCYPSAWDWVSCSSDQFRPRITGLYLGGHGLDGYLPDISSMDALEIIDMHKNSLTGEIPDFLGTFPKLTELNLADNDFFGSVPSSISQNKNIKLDLTGNPKLCITEASCKNTRDTTTRTTTSPGTGSSTTGTPTSLGTIKITKTKTKTKKKKKKTSSNKKKKKKKNVVGIVLGTVLPILFVFWAIFRYFIIRENRKKNAAAKNASDSTAAGKNEMGAAGKSEVPLQAMPTPSSNTSVPRKLQGGQGQEIPAYNNEDYQEVPLYPKTNDVETGNQTSQTMKSETHR